MRSTGPPWASLSLLLSQLTVEIRALTQFATPSVRSALYISHDPRRIFVVSKCNELGVSQVIGTGPLQKLNLCDYLRATPNTFLHFLRGKPLTHRSGVGSGRFAKGRLGIFRCLIRSKTSRRVASTGPSRLSPGLRK